MYGDVTDYRIVLVFEPCLHMQMAYHVSPPAGEPVAVQGGLLTNYCSVICSVSSQCGGSGCVARCVWVSFAPHSTAVSFPAKEPLSRV